MGDQGDLKALDLLAWKYLKLNDTENQIKAHRKAAIFGSTYALKRLGSLNSKLSDKYETTEGRAKQLARIELAYYQTALIRGDTEFLFMAQSYIANPGIELDDADKNFIQKKGVEIYEELKKGRKEIGLSGFEPMPLTVKKYYDFIASRYPSLISGESPLFITE